MDAEASLADKDRKRAALLEEAAGIGAAASATGSELTADEDSRVLALMTRVRVLEGEASYLKRHHIVRAHAERRASTGFSSSGEIHLLAGRKP
jgi:hypothetical protein